MTRGSGLAPVMGSTSMIKKSTAANTDGLINCLLQPGLFYLRIQKSMREKLNHLLNLLPPGLILLPRQSQ